MNSVKRSCGVRAVVTVPSEKSAEVDITHSLADCENSLPWQMQRGLDSPGTEAAAIVPMSTAGSSQPVHQSPCLRQSIEQPVEGDVELLGRLVAAIGNGRLDGIDAIEADVRGR